MREVGDLSSHDLERLDLGCRIGDVVGSSDDVCHSEIDVVANRRKPVKKLSVTANENWIRDAGGIDRDITKNSVCPVRSLLIEEKTPVWRSLNAQFRAFGIAQAKRRAVIDRRQPSLSLGLSLEIEFGGRFETLVQTTDRSETSLGLFVAIQTLRLPLESVPMQAEPIEVPLDCIDTLFARAFPIGIVDPKNELAAGLSGNQTVHQGCSKVTDVKEPGR